MQKQYTVAHPLWMSFYSKPFYHDVARRWTGTGFLFLFLLLALTWIPVLMQAQMGLISFVDNESPKVVDQLPPITFSQGVVSVDAEQPYTITNPDDGNPLFILDTTGEVTSLDETEAVLLLTEDKVIVKKRAGRTETHDLSRFEGEFVLTKEKVHGWLAMGKSWFLPLAYPLCLVFSFLYRIVQALIYTLIGLLFANMAEKKLGFLPHLRLAVMAVVPTILFGTVLDLVNVNVPYWWLFSFVVTLGYLWFGVHSVEAEDPPSADGQAEPLVGVE